MALVIRTNMESLIVQHNLTAATNALNTSIERMTTGFKINTASDNAAGFSIANSWVTKIGSLDVASENAAMGNDLLSTTTENYGLLMTHVQRIRDLTEQAANGTYGSTSLKAIQAEIKARLEEISRVAANAEYNGIKLMSANSTLSSGLDLQVGIDATADSRITLDSSLFTDASVKGLFGSYSGLTPIITAANDGTPVSDLNTDEGYTALSMAFSGLKKDGTKVVIQKDTGKQAKDTLTYLDQAISDLSSRETSIGAAQNRVSSAIEAIGVRSTNLTSSLSTIRDTDVAQESSNYIQAQILQQASATLLATANQAPSIALSLL